MGYLGPWSGCDLWGFAARASDGSPHASGRGSSRFRATLHHSLWSLSLCQSVFPHLWPTAWFWGCATLKALNTQPGPVGACGRSCDHHYSTSVSHTAWVPGRVHWNIWPVYLGGRVGEMGLHLLALLLGGAAAQGCWRAPGKALRRSGTSGRRGGGRVKLWLVAKKKENNCRARLPCVDEYVYSTKMFQIKGFSGLVFLVYREKCGT